MGAQTPYEQADDTPKSGIYSPVKIVVRIVVYVLIMAAILFVSAGRLDWVMGWVYMAVYAGVILVSVLAVPLEMDLAEERTQIKEDVKGWDKIIATVLSILTPLGLLILAGLDQRFGLSPPIPLAVQIVALVIAALGYLLGTWAAASNRFYARYVRIQKERGHSVATGGPYRYIRHPGYAGVSLFYIATALALSSSWTLVLSGLMVVLMIVRTLLEDKVLQEELQGYKEYTAQVRYRLLPGIW